MKKVVRTKNIEKLIRLLRAKSIDQSKLANRMDWHGRRIALSNY